MFNFIYALTISYLIRTKIKTDIWRIVRANERQYHNLQGHLEAARNGWLPTIPEYYGQISEL